MQKDVKNYLINSFWEIGITDPFPDDEDLIIGSKDDVPKDFKLPQKVDDLVYSQSRYVEEYSPLCIYNPAPEILLKIMRACIEVDEVSNLWFN
jgi:hypothetical protein